MFSLSATSSNSCLALEITVISAERLTINDRPVRNNAYVTVTTADNGSWSESRIDRDRGHSPSWNEKLWLGMPLGLKDIVVEVRRRGSSGDRIVGMARIPVSDFTGEYSVPVLNHLHFLSYRLRDAKGMKNGIINVSVRVTSPALMPISSSGTKPEAPASNHRVCARFSTTNCRGTMTTGFPACYANRRKSWLLHHITGATNKFGVTPSSDIFITTIFPRARFARRRFLKSNSWLQQLIWEHIINVTGLQLSLQYICCLLYKQAANPSSRCRWWLVKGLRCYQDLFVGVRLGLLVANSGSPPDSSGDVDGRIDYFGRTADHNRSFWTQHPIHLHHHIQKVAPVEVMHG